MRCMFQISDEVGAVMVTSPASPVASGVAIMTAQNGQPRRDCCCLNLIGHYYVYIYIQKIQALCSSVPKSSTENTLHVKIYDNLLHSLSDVNDTTCP